MGCPRMEVKMKSLIVAVIVLMSTLYLALVILPVNVKAITRYVGGPGPGNYSKIQLAIDDSNPGDTIYVYSGTYNEDVSVYKPLTLIGESRDSTIIHGSGMLDTILVTADWVNITGFTAENSASSFGEAGIRLFFVKNCYVANNTVPDNVDGISVWHSSFNTIENNLLWNDINGIYVEESDNNIVQGNIVSNNEKGIYIHGQASSFNSIINNNVSNNEAGTYLESANNITITDNTYSNNGYGIVLFNSSYAVLTYNAMSGEGIHMDGDNLEHWNTHEINTSNTVGGKPIRYWKNITGGTVLLDAGEVILANCRNVVVENQNVSKGSVGIVIGVSSHITITNNTASSNYGVGIYISGSDNSTIQYNNASSNGYAGISTRNSITNVINDNTVSSNGGNGIHFHTSGSNTLTKNNIFLNGDDRGDRSRHSAIYLRSSNYNVITENSVRSNLNSALRLRQSDLNNISNNNISRNWRGMGFDESDGNRLVNNTLLDNTYSTIGLRNSMHNMLVANLLSGNLSGIGLWFSNDNTLVGNYVSSSYRSQFTGITLQWSLRNVLAGNAMVENGLLVDGNDLEHWNTHIIDTSNTVNGRPVRYWKNVTGGTVPLDAGEVILANCTNVVVENQHLTIGSVGIEVGFSSNNIITNNTVSNSSGGIYLAKSDSNAVVGNTVSSSILAGIHAWYSNNNTFSDNNLVENTKGIAFSSSNGNTVGDNNVWNNAYAGIYLHRSGSSGPGSRNNSITNNSVFNNGFGIDIGYESDGNSVAYNSIVSNGNGVYISDESDNNRIHHNNIIDNTQQAYDDRDTNEWDDGYPSGGNYWSDYTGVDAFSGPNQDIPGSDSIGDTPYVIDFNSEDRYPLMNPLGTFPPSAPLNLSATAGDRQVFLTWIPPSYDGGLPITNYRIYRGTTPGGEIFLTEIANVLTHPDTGLTNGQLYCYRVSAVNAIGEGPLSNEACATPTTTPGAPTILQADLSGKDFENVTLVWNLSSDDETGQRSVVGYSILRSMTFDVNGSGYQLHAFVPNGTIGYVDNSSGEGDPKNYFYQVCAVDLNNLSNCSQNQAGKFTRPLLEGTNLISVPLIQSNDSIETVLQTVEWDKVWTYASSTQKWKWYMEFKPYPGELQKINITEGIWINVTQESNLTIAGIVPTITVIALHKGWNLVGFPSFQQDCTVGELKSAVTAERVEGFNVFSPPYFLKVLADGDILQTGFGYWIKTVGETTWVVANS